ncbi:MAG: hotdog domain-containing protein [Mariprofundus sp.]|nr:hotdog domain-containing protein [Mariprofundus sp.]
MIRSGIQQSEFHHAYTVTASDLNRYGMMHGGRLLTLCDEAGYVSAHKHANGDCLTLAVHQARFHHAIQEGEHLVFRARVGLTGHSSLWVFIEVTTSDNGQCVMEAVFVFAAVDGQKRVRQVPAIHAETDEDKQLQIRLKRMKAQLSIKS